MLDQPSNIETGWTDERIATLKKLWAEGLTATQISDEMACGFSRSAILGKVNRLKLPARQSPATTRRERAQGGQALKAALKGTRKPGRPPRAPAFEAAPLPEEELGNDVTSLLGIMDLTNDTCRFMHGDPKGQHGYCGKQTAPNSSWCPHHHHVVFGGRS